MIAAMPRAWSWSIAITTPPAAGCVARTSPRAACARASTAGQPLAPDREGRAEALRGGDRVERVLERRARERPVVRHPLHLAVGAGEVDGPDDAAVAHRLGVAVLEVGEREPLVVVADERDGAGVGAERRPRQRQPHGGPVEGDAGPVAPRPVLPRVVRLVEHHERVTRDPGDVGGAAGHLLVGGDHPVDVGGQAAVGGGPARLEVQVERLGGVRPLALQVRRGRDHDQPAPRVLGQVLRGRPPGRTWSSPPPASRPPGSRRPRGRGTRRGPPSASGGVGSSGRSAGPCAAAHPSAPRRTFSARGAGHAMAEFPAARPAVLRVVDAHVEVPVLQQQLVDIERERVDVPRVDRGGLDAHALDEDLALRGVGPVAGDPRGAAVRAHPQVGDRPVACAAREGGAAGGGGRPRAQVDDADRRASAADGVEVAHGDGGEGSRRGGAAER